MSNEINNTMQKYDQLEHEVSELKTDLAGVKSDIRSVFRVVNEIKHATENLQNARQVSGSLIATIVFGVFGAVSATVAIIAVVGSMAINPLKEQISQIRNDQRAHMAEADHPWGVLGKISEVKAELVAHKAATKANFDYQNLHIKDLMDEQVSMLKNRFTKDDGHYHREQILNHEQRISRIEGKGN